eukprot:TRINITY_DN18010_c0_g1_i3.p1 TRINITY_DN18010_c0_g1~~TRINITY_DN18010_c0_g1_i3.p1  ORF type:complete len:325 (+),score=50.26 TRINITY_DN18010_c0_g1_i3:119-1093(+)
MALFIILTLFNLFKTILTDSCSGIVAYVNDTGSFRSNSLPGTYDDNVQCTWFVNVVGAHEVSIAGETEADYDLFHVYWDGGARLGNSGIVSFTLFLSGPFYVIFDSDGSIPKSGFEVSWKPISANCSGLVTYSSDTGSFVSNAVPGTYANNLTCGWDVNVENSHIITILGKTEANDIITIQFQNSSNLTLSGSLDGAYIVNGSFKVSFQTDEYVVQSGFQLSWEPYLSICSGNTTLTSDSGSFRSNSEQGSYLNNIQCGWDVNVVNLHLILITGVTEAFFDFITIQFQNSSSLTVSGSLNGAYIVNGLISSFKQMHLLLRVDLS